MPSKKPLVHRLDENQGEWTRRILVGTPTTGMVRMEWVLSRYGQTIPTNWSHVDHLQWMNAMVPLRYLVADAQNLIAKAVVEEDFEWLLFLEQDNIIPKDTLIRLNAYMRDKKVPVVSGLYFTKSDPPEPLLYRGRGNSFYQDWRLGDKVWVDGIPMGCTMIHGSIIKALWEISPEYAIGGQVTRRVFDIPQKNWSDPESGNYNISTGTSDLDFCTRVIKEEIFKKAGWPEIQKKKYPFLVDTNIFVLHIDENGRKFPLTIPERFKPLEKKLNKGEKKNG